VDAQVRLALSRSHLRELPGDVLGELMVGAGRVRIPAGSVTHWEGEPAPFLELVMSGVVRVFVAAPDGRTMTIRYCRPGALIGAASLFAAGYAMPAPTQALVDAELLRLSPAVARRAAERDVRVASALLGELSERVLSFVWEHAQVGQQRGDDRPGAMPTSVSVGLQLLRHRGLLRRLLQGGGAGTRTASLRPANPPGQRVHAPYPPCADA
jgi:Cyclic nucleotide-binding domain